MRGFFELSRIFSLVLRIIVINADNTSGNTKFENEGGSRGVKNCTVDKSHPSATDPEHILISDLMKHYNADARPILNKSAAVKVTFDLAFNQIVDLDSRQQTLKSKIWLRQFWVNPYLTWDYNDYCGIKFIILNSKKIWKPDIVLYNSIGHDAAIYNSNYMIKIHHDGQTEWYCPAEIKSICHIDIKDFPFDTQQCRLKFGSWIYTGEEVDIQPQRETADLKTFTANGEWKLISAAAKRNSIKYTCCPISYIDITYTLNIRRRVRFYMNNLILPCVILGALTALSFYLPPESGERISLVMTILLGLTVFMLLYNESIPPTSESTPLIGKYFFAILLQVTSCLVITCLILRCYHHNPFKEMPRWFRYLIFNVLAPILRMKFPHRKHKIDNRRRPKQTQLLQHNKHVYTTETYVPNGKDRYPTCWSGDNRETSPRNSNTSLEKAAVETTNDGNCEGISNQVDILLDYFDNEQKVDVKRDEWHFASIVLDQVFFYMFAATIIFSAITFYTMIPS